MDSVLDLGKLASEGLKRRRVPHATSTSSFRRKEQTDQTVVKKFPEMFVHPQLVKGRPKAVNSDQRVCIRDRRQGFGGTVGH